MNSGKSLMQQAKDNSRHISNMGVNTAKKFEKIKTTNISRYMMQQSIQMLMHMHLTLPPPLQTTPKQQKRMNS